MLDLDGSDPQPESAGLSAKDRDEFRSEAARFQQKQRAKEGTKQGSHIVVLLIAAVLLFGLILALTWAAVQSYSSMRPLPSAAGWHTRV